MLQIVCKRLGKKQSKKPMTREKAEKIPELPNEEAIAKIMELGDEAEKHEELSRKGKSSESFDDEPATPSGMKTPYKKPPGKKRKKKPG